MTKFILRKFPLFALQLATIWSQRMSFAVTVFGTILFCIIMSFAGWMENTHDVLNICWSLLIIWLFVVQSLLIKGEKNRGELFYSFGRIKDYCISEWISLVISLVPLILICSGIVSLYHHSAIIFLYLFITMTMVIGASSHAMICNLLPKLVQLPYSKRVALMIVISGPWVIPTWLLGMTAGESILNGSSFLYPMLGIVALMLIQVALGNWINN